MTTKRDKLRALERERKALFDRREAGDLSEADYKKQLMASWEKTKVLVMTRKDIRRKSVKDDDDLI